MKEQRSIIDHLLVISNPDIQFLPSATDIPIIEHTPQNPINPYGRSKLMIEKILIDYHKAYKLPVSILRYFNAAGADIKGDIGEDHNPETHLIPLVLEALFNKDGSIKVNGIDYPTFDGTCIRDYVHVSDLAKAHVLALNKIINDRSLSIYNLGNGKGYSIMEVIDTAKKVTGKEIKILKSILESKDCRSEDHTAELQSLVCVWGTPLCF